MNVLVTGGAGYVGRHTCKILADNGHTPITIDNLSTGQEWAVQWGPLYRGDIADSELVKKVIEQNAITAVIHLAASSYINESVHQPLKYYENNFVKSAALFSSLEKLGIEQVVFSSTCAVYGQPDYLPVKENAPIAPLTAYGRSKYMAEEALRDICSYSKMKGIVLRYFNAAGASDDGTIGAALDDGRIISLALKATLREDFVLTVTGADHQTPDGTCVRDFVHVDDIARAHLQALAYAQQQTTSHFEVFNLGSGQGTSIREILQMTEKITGKAANTQWGQRRHEDAPYLIADSTLARARLNWSSSASNVENVIRTASNWYQHLERRARTF